MLVSETVHSFLPLLLGPLPLLLGPLPLASLCALPVAPCLCCALAALASVLRSLAPNLLLLASILCSLAPNLFSHLSSPAPSTDLYPLSSDLNGSQALEAQKMA